MISRKTATAVTSVLFASASVMGLGAVDAADAAGKPSWSKNCTSLNKNWAHGVGKAKAVDHTSGKRVTNFLRSDRLYKQAMGYNRGLDRDKDGIACEKA